MSGVREKADKREDERIGGQRVQRGKLTQLLLKISPLELADAGEMLDKMALLFSSEACGGEYWPT